MFIGFGDLAQSHQMRRLTADAKANIMRLSTEVTTGVAARPSDHLQGNLRPLASIEATLSNLGSYQARTREVVLSSDMMQSSLEVIEKRVADVLQVLTSTVNFPTDTNLGVSGEAAEQALRSSFQALNTSGPTGSLFSGVSTDQAPLADFQVFKDALDSIGAVAIDGPSLLTSIEAFFDDPMGYDSQIYMGSDQPLSRMKIGATVEVNLNGKADQSEIKETLKGLSLAYLANTVPDTYSVEDRSNLANAGYATLLQSQTGLNHMRADVGRTQEKLEANLANNEAQRTSYLLARQALIGIDPFEAATALESQQTQLETIYAITGRLSRLNLTDFI